MRISFITECLTADKDMGSTVLLKGAPGKLNIVDPTQKSIEFPVAHKQLSYIRVILPCATYSPRGQGKTEAIIREFNCDHWLQEVPHPLTSESTWLIRALNLRSVSLPVTHSITVDSLVKKEGFAVLPNLEINGGDARDGGNRIMRHGMISWHTSDIGNEQYKI